MKDRFQGLWGMGARPHVSEAKRYPLRGAGSFKVLFAGLRPAPSGVNSRLEKPTFFGGRYD